MRYLSVCSGIEAATVAWHPLGWEAAAFADIEKFPSQVLAHHYPTVPNLGDMTKFKEWNLNGAIDLLVGGTPCQSFSVAGLRAGLDDPRGNLMLTYVAILERFKPKWFVWENVPGVLSSNKGRDFGAFLAAVGQCGYGFAYRVLDAKHFGVPQRRRRVFVVGCLGDWESAAKVLFEPESVRGDIAPRREKRQDASSRARPSIASGKPTVGTLMANAGTKLWLGNQEALTGDYHILQPAYGIPGNWIGRKPENGGNAVQPMHDVAPCLTKADRHGVAANMAVRRLTPVECERLQGFPDSYTDIKPNGKDTPDGPRYRALGNSMAVPVMAYIGKRIAMVEGAKELDHGAFDAKDAGLFG